MKTSNSKLTKNQKQSLKNLKVNFPKIKFAQFGRVTFAYTLSNSGKGQVSWSIASEQEQKIRAKVGEYYAMERLVYGQHLPFELVRPLYYNIIDMLQGIAEAIT